ncbi:MAG: ATP-binding protein [Acutalibacteraceae bacterium]
MKKLLSLVRAAVDRYDMIDDGDKIAVGVSGGKDSLALLYALARLRSFYPKHFEVIAITLDYRFGGMDGDYSEIQKLCDNLNVKYVVKKNRPLGRYIQYQKRKKILAASVPRCVAAFFTIQLRNTVATKSPSVTTLTTPPKPL